MATWFIDTGFAIALAVRRDKHHSRAAALASEIQRNQIQLVTTHAVIFEIGAALSKQELRADAAALMHSLLHDSAIQVRPINDAVLVKALELFEKRLDKDWSLCDCSSFVVMQELNISQALSTDQHFEQAGFVAMLLTKPMVH